MDEKRYTETIGEDECVFTIYPNELLLNKQENKLKATAENLNAIKREVDVLSEGYIWHNELFEIQAQNLVGEFWVNLKFQLIIDSAGEDPLSYRGGLNYGVNIEDEWFLVHVLLQLTERFDDLVVK